MLLATGVGGVLGGVSTASGSGSVLIGSGGIGSILASQVITVSGTAVAVGAASGAVGVVSGVSGFGDLPDSIKAFQGTGNSSGGDVNGTGKIPVKEKIRASNGLDYQSNPKHTPGQSGSRPNAGIEPSNSLDLFSESVSSSKNPNHRYAYDETTKTLHRFFNDGNGTWHWSGSTNQGANSLTGAEIPIDIKRLFNLPMKGW